MSKEAEIRAYAAAERMCGRFVTTTLTGYISIDDWEKQALAALTSVERNKNDN